jgi:iron complex outermembrane receptor protein
MIVGSGLRASLSAGAAVACMAVATSAAAETRNFNVPAQAAGAGVATFAQQADVQVLMTEAAARGLRTGAVQGTMSVEQGLAKLLSGSGLAVATNDGRTITLKRVAAGPQGEAAAVTAAANPTEVDEVTVTGTNIRGLERIAAPAVAFTRQDLARTGFETLESVLASLPSNLGEISPAGAVGTGVSRIANSNTDGTSGVSLRGLGPDATLVLVNGKRRAGGVSGGVVDLSAIPLSAVERIDVVTGGRSAIYGSDAVAGVVNVTLRRRFQGAESQFSYGGARDGGERLQLSHVLGIGDTDRGLVLAADYLETSALDVVQTGIPTVSAGGIVPERFTLIPKSTRMAVIASGSVRPSDDLEIYGDGGYTFRKSKADLGYRSGPTRVVQNTVTSARQTDASVGARLSRGDWTIDASASLSRADIVNRAYTPTIAGLDQRAEVRTAMIVADGPTPMIAGLQPRVAVGAEVRRESLDAKSNRTGLVTNDLARDVRSVFGELAIPLFDTAAGSSLFELSLAGRYDDYSRIGGSFTPQAGLIFQPRPWLTVRGAYSEAFRAPDLSTLQLSNALAVWSMPDPTSPTGRGTVLFNSGGNADLKPETARTWTFGVDVQPTPTTKVSLNYFHIRYRNRIDEPAIGGDRLLVLRQAALYPTLLNRAPSRALVDALRAQAASFSNFGTDVPFNPATQDVLTVFPNLVYFDNRRANVAEDTASGIDLDATTRRGPWIASLRATYFLALDRKTTPDTPAISQLERQGKPTDFRARAGLGREGEVLSAYAYVNYSDGYFDKVATPPRSISPWATLDLVLRVDGNGLSSPMLEGVTATFSADNVLDARPPRFANQTFGLGYDPANANPYGRYVSVRLAKRW